MTDGVDRSEPCGNEECDRCYPLPRFKISQHRIQHITYQREIKAVDLTQAMAEYNQGTAWPGSYDDVDGSIVQQDDPVAEQMPPSEFYLTKVCYHDLDMSSWLSHSSPDPPDELADLHDPALQAPSVDLWRRDDPPRGVRLLVTWLGVSGDQPPRVKVASASSDEAKICWYSDGVRLGHVVAWMPAPDPAQVEPKME